MAGHRAATYLNSLMAPLPKQNRKLRRLSEAEAWSVQKALKEDAKGYYFSGMLSFVEALHGPPRTLYTWTTVKLYYAVFYTLRAILALHNVSIFYVDSSHPTRRKQRSSAWVIRAETDNAAIPAKGTTHEAVLDSFRTYLPQHMLASPIGADEASDWLMQRRVDANYKHSPFPEPDFPDHFEVLVREGVRRILQKYMHPDNDLLAFDPKHAMVAYPLLALRYAKQDFAASRVVPLSEIDRSTIAKHCKDRAGPLPDLLRFLDVSPSS